MFCYPCKHHKKRSRGDVKVGDLKSSSPQKSDKNPNQQSVVLDPLCATSATTGSTPTEAPKTKPKKVSWWRRLFCRKKKTKKNPVKEDIAGPPSSATDKIVSHIKQSEAGEADIQEASSILDSPVSAAPELQPENKDVEKVTNQPSTGTEKSEVINKDSEIGEVDVASSTPDTPVSALPELQPEHEDVDPTTEESENTHEESVIGEAGVKEASSTPDTPTAVSPELQPEHKDVEDGTNQPSSATEKIEFINKYSEGAEAHVQEASSTPDTPVSALPELQPEHEDVAPATEESFITSENTNKELEVGEAEVREVSSILDTPAAPADDTIPSSTTDRSENTDEELEAGEADVNEASSTPDTLVELYPDNKYVSDDTNHLSSATENSVSPIKQSEAGEADIQETSSTPDSPVAAAPELQPEHEVKEPKITKSSPETAEVASDDKWSDAQPNHKTNTNDDSCDKKVNTEVHTKTDGLVPRLCTPPGLGGSLKAEPNKTDVWTKISGHVRKSCKKKKLSRADLHCLGLPNLAQTCYMNSTLQALLTLSPFVQGDNTQNIWSSHSIMRGFIELGICRLSNNKAEKMSVLSALKQTVAEFNSEFRDHHQKDAHEFLTSVLDMMRSQSLDLQRAALHMGMEYTCPVNAHITFQMLSSRICNGCGIQSMREEDFTNLSLDLVTRGSVRQCLENYLKEDQLSYLCECGAETSSQQWSFLTLPNVLILQLKRFRFTKTFSLEKVRSPVVLSTQLVLNAESSSIKQVKREARYSLVSIVNHLGSSAHSGHYICDGAYKGEHGDTADLWLTYDDKHVSKKTCSWVCRKRQKTAYLLFYEKQVSEKHIFEERCF